MNVRKAFQFEDYTKFYTEHVTQEHGSWTKLPTTGHQMAKHQYDWSTLEDIPGYDDDKKTTAAKKKAVPEKKTNCFNEQLCHLQYRDTNTGRYILSTK